MFQFVATPRRWNAGFAAAASMVLCLAMLPRPAQALGMSRGFQTLPIGYPECLSRAYQALRAEGYNAEPSSGASFVGGFKGPHGAYITCGLGPTQQAEINVFVATEGTNDSGVPGNERVRLQQRMAQQQQPATPPPPPASGSLVGSWTLACCNDELGWTLYIKQQQGNAFSGVFSDNYGGGNVTGQLRGNVIEFDRSGAWGKQRWSAQVVNDQGRLRMINGTWTGEYVDRYPGRNNWRAEKQ